MKSRQRAFKCKSWLAPLLLLVGILLLVGVSHTATDLVLGPEPTAIAIHPDSEMAIISHEKDNRVTLLNLNNVEEKVTLPVGRAPMGVAINEATNTGLVCNSKDKNVSVIDLEFFRELYSMEVGGRPRAVAVDSSRNRGMVVNRQDGTVSELDLYLGREDAVIPVGRLPVAIAVDPGLNYAVVVDDVSPARDTVAIIDLDSRQVINKVEVGRGPVAVDIDPDSHLAVVANERSSSLTVIDLATWESRHIPLEYRPVDVATSRVTGQALVLSRLNNLLLAVDLATGEIGKTYPVKHRAAALAVSPYSNRAAVVDASTNSLSLIQLDNPVPILQEVAPASADLFSVPKTVTLVGHRFLKSAEVRLEKDGAILQLPFRFIDHRTLEVDLPDEVRSRPGQYLFRVVNPEPVGGSSDPVMFEVRNVIKLEITSPADQSEVDVAGLTVSGTAISGYPITSVMVNEVAAVYENGIFTAEIVLAPGENSITAVVQDQGGDTASSAITVNYTPKGPPDPVEEAPPLNTTEATDIAAATEFLYTGPNPVQTGVEPETIEARRVAVLRGKVLNRNNVPLAGVTVTILNHPEYGRTLSRADGLFDLAVNGGGLVTINYEKEGYLPVQRQVQTPWRDYVWAPDVIMIPLDGRVTVIDLAAAETIQVAQGSEVADEDGARQATLLFAPGTTAEMVLPDGSSQPLSTISVRATEYTVGDNGPEAMPAVLPANIAYTYCVELSVDEAMAAGATEVRFSQPVTFYLDNFIDFPVGGIVPSGYYDRVRGVWVPSENGRVVKVIGINNGLAELDISGNGQADSAEALAELGVTTEERQNLAELYEPGKSLWRVPISHFTPWDCNWPYGPPPDAVPPPYDPPRPEDRDKPDDPTECRGCVIEAESQVLGESIPITGTPHTLNYRSDRVPGYTGGRTIEIPLSGSSVPGSLRRIELEIRVAGQVHRASFAPLPNQRTTFTWDGKDGYGRPVQGAVELTYHLRFVYPVVYLGPANFRAAFGRAGGAAIGGSRGAAVLDFSRMHTVTLTGSVVDISGVGRWSLDRHHFYSAKDNTTYRGDGTRQSATILGPIIETIAGTGSWGHSGGLAVNARLYRPSCVSIDPDGTIYIADTGNHRIRSVGTDGIITTHAGSGFRAGGLGDSGYSGDDGPAVNARLNSPTDIALGPDGSIYIADSINHRIRRVGTDGIITTVAGTGPTGWWSGGFSGDGGSAVEARLDRPHAVAIGPDGSIYIADTYNHRIRRVGTDGIITTIAGTGYRGFSGDGGPADEARLFGPIAVAIGPDGSIYIADTYNHRIRRVGTDGIITTVAGTGSLGYSGDGGPATEASFSTPSGITFGPDGSLYIAANHRIRRVGTDGIITTIAGTGYRGFSGDGGPADEARLGPRGVSLGPDGSIYVADSNNHRIRHIRQPITSLAYDEILIAAADHDEYYVFTPSGRHLRTLDSLTGTTRKTFSYDEQGRLVRLEDGDGNATLIERNSDGDPTAIIAPDGQRTELALDANGYLASVTNPAGEAYRLAHTPSGLLTKVIKPTGAKYTYNYNAVGRLTHTNDPDGGGWTIARTKTGTGTGGRMTSAEGRTWSFDVDRLSKTELLRTSTNPDGAVSTRRITTTDSEITEVANTADGTVRTLRKGPDPRMGMSAPVLESAITTLPSGLQSTINFARLANLEDQDDPLSLVSLTDTVNINGRTLTSVYQAASRTYTTTTTAGRTSSLVLDANGRISQSRPAGLLEVGYHYDLRGRLSSIAQGDGAQGRYLDFTYDSQGYPAAISDGLGVLAAYEYDLAGRVTRQELADGREIRYGYDANGNLTAITPPGRSPHLFTYTATDRQQEYLPPAAGAQPAATRYAYNLDGELTQITRPDGQTLELGYSGCCGKLAYLDLPHGRIDYSYHSATGRLSGITTPENNTLAFTYDGFLPLTQSWTGEINGSVARGYDNNFQLQSLNVNGQTITYGYDSDGLPIQAGDLTLARDPANGFLTGTSLAGVATTQAYNGFGEMTAFSASHDATELFSTSFSRDQRGRITEKTETIAGTTTTFGYLYDEAGRLIRVTQDGAIVEYTYDQNGNRLQHSAGGTTITGSYEAQDRMTAYGNATYQYTANGELLRKTQGTQVTSYTYDVLGNLKAVNLPDGRNIEYIIDGSNRRIGKKIDGVLVQGFLYQDQLNPVAELDANGQVISRFIYASRANVPDYLIKNGTTYRIITDHLGSPRLVVNTSTGEIAQRIDYDEFGNVLQDTNPGFQPFGFAGGLHDRDTNLTRFGARDYDPQTGRWTAKDPILFAGGDTNLYGYVLNDPINWIDPEGKIGIAGAAVGGVIGAVSGALGAYTSGGNSWDIASAAFTGGLGGAVYGFLPGAGLLAHIGKGAAIGGIQNFGAQFMGILNDPCQRFNYGSLAGSILGGAIGAGRANAVKGLDSSALGQISQGILALGPSLAFGALGTSLGNL
ncbi:YD repeat protein [Desulfurivibrio alkaliphilus AHT 2]|uniref:YD repeat protein n=2 Tax=Desulfurivibrio alkaliphilus TaxID=427923 RepID=D6Z6T0_DESAT|nr:YD repeat protein [Desulfurivibrio alkaliphilus AHT 2]